MNDLTFTEMQAIQSELRQKYKDIWKPNSPAEGRSQLLWMLIEAGEAADIIKKKGDAAIIDEPDTRAHFIEELCDVMMYFNDVMQCYSVTPAELAKVYRDKHSRNMKRW
jgi:NTP pyrophosphatase (non-canonical NTP hydrolase)